jgi:transcriptional regulator with XRE-family HTH domain
MKLVAITDDGKQLELPQQNLGQWIRVHRQLKGWSLRDISQKLKERGHKVTRQAIFKWETGLNEPKHEHMVELARLFSEPGDETVAVA